MSEYVFISTILPALSFADLNVVNSSLFKAIGLIDSGAADNEIPTAVVDEKGIRLEFAQFGHFDSFDVIRSMVSMASVADGDLPTPIATGLKTMYYVDSNVVEGLLYHYKVRVWRGTSSFISDEVSVEAVEGEPLIDEFVVAFNEFDTGAPTIDEKVGVVWNDYSAYWEVEAGKGFLRLPQPAVAFINLPAISAQEYTMEFFVRLDNKDYNHGVGYLFSTNYVTAQSWSTLGIRNSGQLTVYINGNLNAISMPPVTITDKLMAEQWVHIAYEQYGTMNTFYVEGVSVGSDIANSDNPALKWCFGGASPDIDAPGQWFQGSIDCVRVSIGIARYKGAFTPPPRGYK